MRVYLHHHFDTTYNAYSKRSLLRHGGNAGPVVFMGSRVQSIDLDRKRVSTDDGELEWDYLVVALGSTTNFFNLYPGLCA